VRTEARGAEVASRGAEVAARGTEAVAALRDSASTVDKLLLHVGPELLDLPTTPAHVKHNLLADLERIGRVLLLHRQWTQAVGRLIVEARRTRRGKPVRVLDVGAGAGGLLFRLEDWARSRRIPVELHGLDATPEAVEVARRRAGEEGRRVHFQLGDATHLADHADGAVDVAVSTLMLHHLPPGAAACALAELDRVAAVNYYAFDLRRTLWSVPAAWAFFRLGGFDAPTRHDGLLSLRRGFSIAELEALLRSARVENARVAPLPPTFAVITRA
jgi:SAM-dependent methyltransferase